MFSCTPPHKDRCRPTAQANWPKLMADDFSHRKALDSSMTGSDYGKNVTEVLEIKIVPRCDVNATRRDCFCMAIDSGTVGSVEGGSKCSRLHRPSPPRLSPRQGAESSGSASQP